MEAKYVLEKMGKARCPKCGKRVLWLRPEDDVLKDPSFYICYACLWVAQVGVGPVELIKIDEIVV